MSLETITQKRASLDAANLSLPRTQLPKSGSLDIRKLRAELEIMQVTKSVEITDGEIHTPKSILKKPVSSSFITSSPVETEIKKDTKSFTGMFIRSLFKKTPSNILLDGAGSANNLNSKCVKYTDMIENGPLPLVTTFEFEVVSSESDDKISVTSSVASSNSSLNDGVNDSTLGSKLIKAQSKFNKASIDGTKKSSKTHQNQSPKLAANTNLPKRKLKSIKKDKVSQPAESQQTNINSETPNQPQIKVESDVFSHEPNQPSKANTEIHKLPNEPNSYTTRKSPEPQRLKSRPKASIRIE